MRSREDLESLKWRQEFIRLLVEALGVLECSGDDIPTSDYDLQSKVARSLRNVIAIALTNFGAGDHGEQPAEATEESARETPVVTDGPLAMFARLAAESQAERDRQVIKMVKLLTKRAREPALDWPSAIREGAAIFAEAIKAGVFQPSSEKPASNVATSGTSKKVPQ